MNPRRGFARLLEAALRAVVPGATAGMILRDLEEGYRARRVEEPQAGSAGRWYRRQLLLALAPWRVAALRRIELHAAGRFGGHESVGVLGRLIRAVGYVLYDLRYSLRLLVRTPGMTTLTAVVLAGGLGVSIFTFSMLYTMMLEPLPLPDGERIVRVMSVEQNGRSNLLDAVDLRPLRESAAGIVQISRAESRSRLLRGGDTPRTVIATVADPALFDLGGTPPLMGRSLTTVDALRGAEAVAVLGYTLWHNDFGADPHVLGRLIEVGGVSTRVVGVMPEGYGFPVWSTLWLPMAEDELAYIERGERFPDVFAMLAPGVTPAQADAELDAIMQRWRLQEPVLSEQDDPAAVSARVLSVPVAQMGDEAGFAFVTMNLVASSILLLACINVANLLVSRASERARETTIRVALGAPRLRLVLQMMGESVLISVSGGLIALFVAGEALEALDSFMRSLAPEGLPFWYAWGLGTNTLGAAACFVLFTILLVGGIPAWRATRGDSGALLRDGSSGALGSVAGRATRALVVVQVAVIAVLMFIGGISAFLTRQMANLDLGMDTERVLVSTVSLPDDGYLANPDRRMFFDRLVTRLQESGTVENAMLRFTLGDGMSAGSEIAIEGDRYDSPRQQPRAAIQAIRGPLATLGTRLLTGRLFDERERSGGALSALVSDSVARGHWPDGSAVGRQILLGDASAPGEWRTIVGVVSDVLVGTPFGRDNHRRSVYVPFDQFAPRAASVTFKHAGDQRAAVLALHEVVESLDRELLPGRVLDFDELFLMMGRTTALTTRVVFAAFGFALLLAVTGIYGLTARSVLLRTQEIGLRRAMGATEGRIVRLFLGSSARQLAYGLGVALAVGAATSFAASQVADMSPLIFVGGGVAVLMAISAIVLLATYLPTRRAVRLEPSVALWHE